MTKQELLTEFREKAIICYENIEGKPISFKEKAAYLNREIIQIREEYIQNILKRNDLNLIKLKNILLLTYVSYIVMLEYRNLIWNYEYMAFSRRIGELWEPMCKLPFEYPINELNMYIPPNIEDIKRKLESEINGVIDNLMISQEEKERLLRYYQAMWGLINNSGNISLTLDLHFEQYREYFDVDYKSGFSSNEKGNTNRLLLVASIYKILPDKHNNLIFVRQKEEENNHYLQTLKNSGLWGVYCADEAYQKIKEFTGFDIKEWMNTNMDWINDITPEFREYLSKNDLLKYLNW